MRHSLLILLIKFLKYLLRSNGPHGVHSPFLFELITETRSKHKPEFFDDIENIRKQNLSDHTSFQAKDFGAGSEPDKQIKTISSVAKRSLKPKSQAQKLFHLCSFFKPNTIIELGTSLGITSLYLSKASPNVNVYTFEGDPHIIEKAQVNFQTFGASNIQIIPGNIDQSLHHFLEESPLIDIAFIDGNHRKEPTLEYFEHILSKAHNNTLFIFDDIYWSSEMEECWKIIQKDERVSLTVDCFHFGMVFIKRELSKQDITIRL